MLESALEDELRTYLLRTGFMVIKTDAARRYVPGKSQGGRALPPGFPDLLAMTSIARGSRLFLGALLETKSAIGELRPSQIAFGRELDSWDIPHHLVRSLDELQELELLVEARTIRQVLKKHQAMQRGLE